jgi:hypothetical protein
MSVVVGADVEEGGAGVRVSVAVLVSDGIAVPVGEAAFVGVLV